MSSNDLKSSIPISRCPFCGSSNCLLRRFDGKPKFWVTCQTCRASGAISVHPEIAVLMWNERKGEYPRRELLLEISRRIPEHFCKFDSDDIQVPMPVQLCGMVKEIVQ